MNTSFRKIFAGLVVLICVFAFVLISFFPSISHLISFNFLPSSQQFPIPSSSDVIVFFPDFPLFWEKLSSHPIGVSGYENLYSYLYDVELGLRKRFGIRLTPVRWNFWVGNPCVFCFFGDEHWALIAKPRFYARMLVPLLLRNRLRGDEGGNMFFSVVDNYVIFSNCAFGREQLQYLDFQMNSREDCIINAVANNRSIELQVELKDDIKISGNILGSTETNQILQKPVFINAVVSISGEFVEFVDNIILRYLKGLVDVKTIEYFEFPLKLYLRTITDSPVEHLLLRLLDLVKTQNGVFSIVGVSDNCLVPIPVFAGWFPEEEKTISTLLEMVGLPPYTPVYPTKWDNVEGYVIPLWGRAYQLCLARYNDGFLFCTNESTMSEVVVAISSASELSTSLFVDFESVSREYKKLYQWAVALDTRYFINPRDFSELYPPWEKFLQTLGRLEIKIFEDSLSSKILVQGKIGK